MTACSQGSILRSFIHLFVQHSLSVCHAPGLPLLFTHWGRNTTPWFDTSDHLSVIHKKLLLKTFIGNVGYIFYLGCMKGSDFSGGHGGVAAWVCSRLEWCPSGGYFLFECSAPCFPLENYGLRRKGHTEPDWEILCRSNACPTSFKLLASALNL